MWNGREKMRGRTRYFCIHVAGDGRARQTLRVIYELVRMQAGGERRYTYRELACALRGESD
jgi:hypothetical protein